MTDRTVKAGSVTARLSGRHVQMLERVTDRRRDPYAPTKTSVIERGIELAVREMERGRTFRRRRGSSRDREVAEDGS